MLYKVERRIDANSMEVVLGAWKKDAIILLYEEVKRIDA